MCNGDKYKFDGRGSVKGKWRGGGLGTGSERGLAEGRKRERWGRGDERDRDV